MQAAIETRVSFTWFEQRCEYEAIRDTAQEKSAWLNEDANWKYQVMLRECTSSWHSGVCTLLELVGTSKFLLF